MGGPMYSEDRDEVLLVHVVVGFVMEDFDTKEKAFPDVVRAINQMATATALHRDIMLVVLSVLLLEYIQSSFLISARCPQQQSFSTLLRVRKMPNTHKGGHP